MVTNLTQLGYVNNYDKNRYLEKISKAAVYIVKLWFTETYIIVFFIIFEDHSGRACIMLICPCNVDPLHPTFI